MHALFSLIENKEAEKERQRTTESSPLNSGRKCRLKGVDHVRTDGSSLLDRRRICTRECVIDYRWVFARKQPGKMIRVSFAHTGEERERDVVAHTLTLVFMSWDVIRCMFDPLFFIIQVGHSWELRLVIDTVSCRACFKECDWRCLRIFSVLRSPRRN